MVQQHRRENTQLKMTPYNSMEGQGKKELGETLSGVGQLLKAGAATVDKIGGFAAAGAKQKKLENEPVLATAQLDAFSDLQSANDAIREKYKDNPDGDAMNEELRAKYDEINSKHEANLDEGSLKDYRHSVDSNMKELIRANYSDARSRRASIAAKKERELKTKVADAQQQHIYNAGRRGAPMGEVAATVIPKELRENPNMPVSPAVKKQIEAIPALYVSGMVDKPAYDTYDQNGNLDAQGIIPAQDIHAPKNFDKVIDDYYDRVVSDIDALPGLTDKQREKFADKANLAREMRKQDFGRYLGAYKTGTTADFIRDPQSEMLDSHLFKEMPKDYANPVTTEDINNIGMAEDDFDLLVDKYKKGTITTEEINAAGADEDKFGILADKYIKEQGNGTDEMGADFLNPRRPTIVWDAKPIHKEMQRMSDNAYKPSTATTPRISTAATTVKKLRIPEAMDESEMEAQSETALRNANEVLEDPTTTNEERTAVRQIVAQSLENPEYRAAANELFAKAQILDQYANLFKDDTAPVETDKDFKIMNGLTGLERDMKFERVERSPEDIAKDPWWKRQKYNVKTTYGKPTGFDFEKADEKNRAKYKLVRDTYMNVLQSASKGDMESANEFINALPYNVAKINYGSSISPTMIDQFRAIDADGEQTVKPQFMFKGYNFEYLGMDKTGTVLARRKL